MPETDSAILQTDLQNRFKERAFTDSFIISIFKDLLKKWWIFSFAGLIAGILGFFYAAVQKPEFESRLTFALDAGSNDGGLSGAMSLAAQFGFGIGGGQSMFDGDNILQILKSRRVIEKVLLSSDTLNSKPISFADFYLEISGARKSFAKNNRLRNVFFPVNSRKESLSYIQDSILNNIYLSLSTSYIYAGRPDRKLSIYEVRVKSFDEKFSKVFTDRLIATTIDFYTEITSKKDKETLNVLELRVAALKGNVAGSIDSRVSSQDANMNPAFAAAQSPLIKQQYNMQAYGEAYKEMFKTLEVARYQYLKKIPLLQIIDSADYPMKRTKPGKLKTAMVFSVLSVLFSIICFWIYRIYKPGRKEYE